MVKVKDLTDQLGVKGPRPFLYCLECGAEYSAHKGDYWQLKPEHVLECCDIPMVRVVRKSRLVEV